METNKIICGDCLEVMKDFPANSFDTIITDPPYGLGFMGKDWDTFKDAGDRAMEGGYEKQVFKPEIRKSPLRKIGTKAAFAGSYDHSRNAEFQQWFTAWATEVLRIAKPGAIMLIFGGTRTYHRLMCAIEDAGWQIRDCMMWLYGSGFPKSLNISKAIDKAKGAERKRIKVPEAAKGSPDYGKYSGEIDDNNPQTDLAKLWDGYGTALKPAWEPIVVAMKPLDGTFAHNAEKWGVAGLNIDGGRIDYQSEYDKSQATPQGKCTANIAKGARPDVDNEERSEFERPEQKGRWPANVILDETIEGEWTRYFYCPKASRSERNVGLEEMEAKPIKGRDTGQDIRNVPYKQRTSPVQNTHPTVKPLKLMEYLCILTKTPTGGIVLDPFGGSGTTGMACVNTGREYILIEKDPDYCEIARRRLQAVNTGVPAKKQKQGQMALFEGKTNNA